MTTSEQTLVTVLGKVVGVYRQCAHCDEWKRLEHFHVQSGGRNSHVTRNMRVCAACRRREFGLNNQN